MLNLAKTTAVSTGLYTHAVVFKPKGGGNTQTKY